MPIISNRNGWKIESDLGSVIREGNVSSGNQGSGQQITFTITQTPQIYKSVYIQIVPSSGQTSDFWDDYYSQLIGGEPANQFALSGFGGRISVYINADRFAEGDETFSVLVYKSATDPGFGRPALAQANFTIADDDEPGFAKHIIGTDDSDEIEGSVDTDIIKGFADNDTISGLEGNDRLDGGIGADKMSGGIGDDIYVVDDAFDQILENIGEGIDTIISSVDFTLTDNVEKLLVSGFAGVGAKGNALANVIIGNAADNALSGAAGDDTLQGNWGNDLLDGGRGADKLDGGAGNDTYIVDNLKDVVVESARKGSDTIESTISYTLGANLEIIKLLGLKSISATGNELSNTLEGNDGANRLRGLSGNDILIGGAGNDKLSGGDGKDAMTGGVGRDAFIFDTAPTSRDRITDFSAADGDKIQLSRAVFAGVTRLGALTSDEFYSANGAKAANDASDRVIYDTASGKLYYDADGQGGAAAVQIAVLGSSSHPVLIYSDIQIIA
jgi:Ca2+-binding RTX toxin-like protein